MSDRITIEGGSSNAPYRNLMVHRCSNGETGEIRRRMLPLETPYVDPVGSTATTAPLGSSELFCVRCGEIVKPAILESVDDVLALISRLRLDLSNEKLAQSGIEDALRSNGVAYEREKRLSGADIPDFFLPPSGLVIEVKMRGARKKGVYRQLARYAEHDEVKALALVTNLAMGLPPAINDKPTFYVGMGRAWI